MGNEKWFLTAKTVSFSELRTERRGLTLCCERWTRDIEVGHRKAGFGSHSLHGHGFHGGKLLCDAADDTRHRRGGQAMNDTSPALEERYRATLMQRTGEERLIMGCGMRDAARAIMEASFLEQDPCASIATLRKGLFLRLYGHEFDAETRTKILAAIQDAALLARR
jgi:hypothetical protein